MTLVRYTVKPGREEENAELVRAVYAELFSLQPPGFRYATFQDGRDFVHVASGDFALGSLVAFRRFQEGIAERCEVAPRVLRDAAVGAYEPPRP
ncbi:hypothetical protein [Candidatus Solirubrobacter pratensis]|uniref:hypothetical protein n=1 Tax=Candidatus Solirubrobacter pratensis TaxID=1298857 RepID=UPI0004193726|nr:hypothetical protein [Candidatus Solirubrobacter pratensis]